MIVHFIGHNTAVNVTTHETPVQLADVVAEFVDQYEPGTDSIGVRFTLWYAGHDDGMAHIVPAGTYAGDNIYVSPDGGVFVQPQDATWLSADVVPDEYTSTALHTVTVLVCMGDSPAELGRYLGPGSGWRLPGSPNPTHPVGWAPLPGTMQRRR